jgi:hypothetical protein
VTGATFTLAPGGQPPSVTLTYASPASAIQISRIRYNPPGPDTRSTKSLNAEWIRLRNTGASTRHLRGWSISDADEHVYRFRRLALRPGASVTVHSGPGRDTAHHRYWNRRGHTWDNRSGLARLRRPNGTLADQCRYNNAHRSQRRCFP